MIDTLSGYNYGPYFGGGYGKYVQRINIIGDKFAKIIECKVSKSTLS